MIEYTAARLKEGAVGAHIRRELEALADEYISAGDFIAIRDAAHRLNEKNA